MAKGIEKEVVPEKEVASPAEVKKEDTAGYEVVCDGRRLLPRILVDDAQEAGCTVVGKTVANKFKYTVKFKESEAEVTKKVEALRAIRKEEGDKVAELMRNQIIGVSHGQIGV